MRLEEDPPPQMRPQSLQQLDVSPGRCWEEDPANSQLDSWPGKLGNHTSKYCAKCVIICYTAKEKNTPGIFTGSVGDRDLAEQWLIQGPRVDGGSHMASPEDLL